MAFVGSFSISPNPIDPSSFLILDTSTGVDPNITDRQIFAYKVDGTTLVLPGSTLTYIDWPPGSASPFPVTGLLTQDYSINFIVNWISSNPQAGGTYTSSLLYTFVANINTFINSQLQSVSAQQNILNDQLFYESMMKLYIEVQNAQNATAFGQQGAAQNALNRAIALIQQKQLYF